jgi:hypothetical protein
MHGREQQIDFSPTKLSLRYLLGLFCLPQPELKRYASAVCDPCCSFGVAQDFYCTWMVSGVLKIAPVESQACTTTE